MLCNANFAFNNREYHVLFPIWNQSQIISAYYVKHKHKHNSSLSQQHIALIVLVCSSWCVLTSQSYPLRDTNLVRLLDKRHTAVFAVLINANHGLLCVLFNAQHLLRRQGGDDDCIVSREPPHTWVLDSARARLECSTCRYSRCYVDLGSAHTLLSRQPDD